MELIENKRVTSKTLSRYKQMPIELGKKVTSPKKTKTHKHIPLKVIKIKDNTKKYPTVRSYSYNRTPNITDKYRSPVQYRPSANNNNTIIPRLKNEKYPKYSNNNIVQGVNKLPTHPSCYNDAYKYDNVPKHSNKYQVRLEHNSPHLKKTRTNQLNDNHINFQYVSELQNKQTAYRDSVQVPYKSKRKQNIIKKKKIIPKKPKKLYRHKCLYLKQEKSLKSQKNSTSELKSQKKYFNANIFVKNKNQSEHFSKLSSEDIYICSILSEDFNIIKK